MYKIKTPGWLLTGLITAQILSIQLAHATFECRATGTYDFDVNGGTLCETKALNDFNVYCTATFNNTGAPTGFGPDVDQVAVDNSGRPYAIRANNLYTVIGTPNEDGIYIQAEEKLVTSSPDSCISDLLIGGTSSTKTPVSLVIWYIHRVS